MSKVGDKTKETAFQAIFKGNYTDAERYLQQAESR